MEKQVYEFISKQTNDPIVERRTCKRTGQEFAIFQGDVDMLDKLSPIIGGVKYKLPLPTINPYERNRRRISFRNDSKIYRRKCDFSGKEFISTYSPDKPYKVYHKDIWFSDDLDGLDYGKDFDSNKSFFEQFEELLIKVPRLGMQQRLSENCDYCCVISNGKNCYLGNVCSRSEDILYSSRVVHSKMSVDCFRCYKIENSYQSIQCNNSFTLKYCFGVNNSSNCLFSINLDSCKHCFMCNNLSNQEYCIRNKKYSKEEYLNIVKKIDFCDKNLFDGLNNEYKELFKKSTYHENGNLQCENVYGGFLSESKNCKICFDLITGEDCKYYFDAGSNEKTCMDCSYGGDIEKSYETLSSGTIGYNNLFTIFCRDSNNLIYSDSCIGCSNCFACAGLRNKQYCIFNNQHSKQEYEILVGRIIEFMKETGERGEFFPISISPFGYNETVAMDYYPLSNEEIIKRSYKLMDKEYLINIPKKYEELILTEIPKNIKDVKDEILDNVIICPKTGKPFRFIKQEIDFYRNHGLPLPSTHPEFRHKERLKKRINRILHLRHCDKCETEMLSVYPGDFEGKVYCEKCYNKEIYG